MMLVAERVTQHASELQVKAGGFASIERHPAYRSLRFARPNANQFPPLVHAPKLEAVGARDPGLDHVEATGQQGDCPGEVEEGKRRAHPHAPVSVEYPPPIICPNNRCRDRRRRSAVHESFNGIQEFRTAEIRYEKEL
jgi:hypothetical protein